MPEKSTPSSEPEMITVPDWNKTPAEAAADLMAAPAAPEVLTPEHRAEINEEMGDEALEAVGIEDPDDIDNMKIPVRLPLTHPASATPSYQGPSAAPEPQPIAEVPEIEQTRMYSRKEIQQMRQQARQQQNGG